MGPENNIPFPYSEVHDLSELGFLSQYSPFSDDFADSGIPLNIDHHGPMIVSVVDKASLRNLTSNTT
jgi:hypothetical protein